MKAFRVFVINGQIRDPRSIDDRKQIMTSSAPFLKGVRTRSMSGGWVSFVAPRDKLTMTVFNRILCVLVVGFVAEAAPELHLSAPAGARDE